MAISNDELAAQLKEQLVGGEHKLALDQEPASADVDENPLDTDFFRALNAYRAAKHKGDANEIAKAETHLQQVVRSELTGE